MAGNIYNPGDKVTIQARWTVNDVETDPTTVSVQVKDPLGNVSQYFFGGTGLVVRDSAGIYHQDVTVPIAGTWFYRWLGSGVVQKNGEDSFIVATSQFV